MSWYRLIEAAYRGPRAFGVASPWVARWASTSLAVSLRMGERGDGPGPLVARTHHK